MLLRLTSLEEPSIGCTAEGEEITDAIGAVITTLYRAKKATFSATNSLVSLELAAAQYGSKKELADADNKIVDYTYEIITIPDSATTVKLSKTPIVSSVNWIYSIADGEVGTAYQVGAAASDTEFVIAGDGTITLPTGLTGNIYVEYQYESENAILVRNNASEFPEACSVVIYAYFRDKCNENIVYSGKIICPKAKLSPESIELALTATGKHPFTFTMMKDYCQEEGEDTLFNIIVSE